MTPAQKTSILNLFLTGGVIRIVSQMVGIFHPAGMHPDPINSVFDPYCSAFFWGEALASFIFWCAIKDYAKSIKDLAPRRYVLAWCFVFLSGSHFMDELSGDALGFKFLEKITFVTCLIVSAVEIRRINKKECLN